MIPTSVGVSVFGLPRVLVLNTAPWDRHWRRVRIRNGGDRSAGLLDVRPRMTGRSSIPGRSAKESRISRCPEDCFRRLAGVLFLLLRDPSVRWFAARSQVSTAPCALPDCVVVGTVVRSRARGFVRFVKGNLSKEQALHRRDPSQRVSFTWFPAPRPPACGWTCLHSARE